MVGSIYHDTNDKIVTCVRDNEVFLDIHEVIDADVPQFRELLPCFLEEGANVITFLALEIHEDKGSNYSI